jgi:hypothetical protein
MPTKGIGQADVLSLTGREHFSTKITMVVITGQ